MNFQTMIDRTYDGMRDAPREFILEVEVKSWLNEAQRDLAHRLKVLQKEVEIAADVDGEYAMPADLIEIRNLRVGAEEADIRWVDAEQWFDAADAQSFSPYGGPFGRVWEGHIEVWPSPAAGTTAKLRYIYEPADLVNNLDISPLPLELHNKMVQFARAQGYLRLDELVQAQTQVEMYERGLPGPPLGQTRIHPMPMQLMYETGPFDTLDAIHRG